MNSTTPVIRAAALEDLKTRHLRRLCLFVIVVSCAEFLIATIGVQIQRLPHSTDFASYYLAGAQARDGLSPYDRAAIIARGRELGFAYNQFPFLYPPPFAIAAEALAHLSFPRARQVWMVLATLALFGALAATVDLIRRQAAALGIADRRLVWILVASFVPSALNSTSVHNDLRAGSVGCMLYLLLALAARELVPPAGGGARRSSILGGSLVAAALLKVTPAALLVWAGWRRAWRAVAIAIGLLALSMLPAIVHWGPGIVIDWWQHAIVPSLHDVVPPQMNQSLDAYLARMLVANQWGTSWVNAPVLHRVLVTVASLGVVVVTLASLRAPRRPAALLPVEMGAVWLAVLAVMRLTWVQTLASMLFVGPALLVVILRAAEREAPWARRAGVAACVGFFLSSAHLPILWAGLRHGPAVVLTGVHLFGVLVLWGVSLVVLRHAGEFEPGAHAPVS